MSWCFQVWNCYASLTKFFSPNIVADGKLVMPSEGLYVMLVYMPILEGLEAEEMIWNLLLTR